MATVLSNVHEALEVHGIDVLPEDATDLVIGNERIMASTDGAGENSDETPIDFRDGQEQRADSLENNQPSQRGAVPHQEINEGELEQLRRERDDLKVLLNSYKVVLNSQEQKIEQQEKDLSESKAIYEEKIRISDSYKTIINLQRQKIKKLENEKVALERHGRICSRDCALSAITWICREKLDDLRDFYCGRALEKIIFFEGADILTRQDLNCSRFMRMLEKCGILTNAEIIYHASYAEKNFQNIQKAWDALKRNKEKVSILGIRKCDGFRDDEDAVRYGAHDEDNIRDDEDAAWYDVDDVRDEDNFWYVVIIGIMFGIVGMIFGMMVLMRVMIWMMIILMGMQLNVNDSEDAWDDDNNEGHVLVIEPMTENEQLPICDPQNDLHGKTWLMSYDYFEKKVIDEGLTDLILFPVDLEKLEQILTDNTPSLHFINLSDSSNDIM